MVKSLQLEWETSRVLPRIDKPSRNLYLWLLRIDVSRITYQTGEQRMRRLAGGLVGISILLVGLCVSLGVQADESTLTVKEIMGKLHKPPDALRTTLQKELKSSEPDWDKIQKDTHKFLELAEAMQKLEPPRG